MVSWCGVMACFAQVAASRRSARCAFVKSELADRFDTYGNAKMELFDYIEVFYNERRWHSTLGQISPAAFERTANEEGVEPVENRQGRGFPQAPHPLSFSMRKEQTTKNDQPNETVH